MQISIRLLCETIQVLAQQGLGKYCDPDFVRYTSNEMQEALEMTREEMDLAAHELLKQQAELPIDRIQKI